MKIENTSPLFKRTMHAFITAMELASDLEDEKEVDLIETLLGRMDFDGINPHSCFEYLDNNFEDYEDFSQIRDGYTTGIWTHLLVKKNGQTIKRSYYGSNLEAPRPISTLMDRIGDTFSDQYIATQLYAFFLPLNHGEGIEINEDNFATNDPADRADSEDLIRFNSALSEAADMHFNITNKDNE